MMYQLVFFFWSAPSEDCDTGPAAVAAAAAAAGGEEVVWVAVREDDALRDEHILCENTFYVRTHSI